MKRLLFALVVGLAVVLAGCGGIGPAVPEAPTAAIAVIAADDADTNDPIPVEATVILGGVRGTITVEEGSVVLRDVPFGTGTPPTQPLTVTAPGYVTGGLDVAPYVAAPIQILLTQVTFHTAKLKRADPAETGTARGHVTSTTGQPVPNALVKFTQIGPGGASEVRGYTDNDGAYIIGGIPIGNNSVTAEAEGFVTSTATGVTVVQDAGGGITPDVDLSLVPGSTQVDVTGIVVNVFTDVPIAGAQVHFGGVADVITDGTGQFTIPNVPVGTYTVTVSASEYDDYAQVANVLPGMARLRFALTPSAPQPPGGPYNVAGKVTLNGRPDNSGATVTAVDTTGGVTWDTATTPASGDYTLFVPPGEYRITASFGTRSVRRTVTVPGGGRILTGIDFVLTIE